ncbi:MAG: insulinase family protein [Candidatus Obscuribacterales bacterium]|nr:insulinase family protein [Candidatus Obscuribacterales bacterium]
MTGYSNRIGFDKSAYPAGSLNTTSNSSGALASNVLRVLTVALLLVSTSFSMSGPLFASPLDSGQAAVRLPNGLRVVIVQESSLPVVSCQLWYRVGARHDPQGFRGTCHVIEHILENNQLARQSSLMRKLISSSAQFDAYTSDDFTVFTSNIQSEDLESAIALQAARFQERSITQAQLDTARVQVLQELKDERSSPDENLSKEVRAVAYRRHPYGLPPSGTAEDVNRLTPGVAQDFLNQWFQPANATLVIAGRINPATALSTTGKYFGPLTSTKANVNFMEVPEPTQEGERRVYLKYDGSADQIFIAFHTPELGHQDAPALIVLEALLNNPLGGILKHRFIDTNLCTRASASYEFRKSPGLFTFHLKGRKDVSSNTLLTEIDRLFNDIKQVTPEPSKLERARNRALFKFFESRTGPYKTAFQLGLFDALGHFELAQSSPEKINQVSSERLKAVANRYLTTANRSIGFLISERSSPVPQTKPGKDRTASINSSLRLAGFKTDRTDLIAGRMPGTSKNDQGVSMPTGLTNIAAKPAAAKPAPIAKQDSAAKMPVAPAKPGQAVKSNAAHPAAHKRPHTAESSTNASPKKPTPPSTPLPPFDLAGIAKSKTLPSGINLVVLTVKSSPIVRIEGTIKAGSVFDPAKRPGLSEFNVTLMNSDSTQISREKSEGHQANRGLGPQDLLGFKPGLTQISFATNCQAKHVGVQLRLLSHHMTKPQLSESAIDSAKDTVASSIKAAHLNPTGLAQEYLMRNLLANKSPYSPPEVHKKLKAIEDITPEEVIEFRNQRIVPGATTIVMVGDITLETAIPLVEAAFKNWQGSNIDTNIVAEANKRNVLKVVVPTSDSGAIYLLLGRLLEKPVGSDIAELMLVDSILFKHPFFARLAPVISQGPDTHAKAKISSQVTPLSGKSTWALSVAMPAGQAESTFEKLKVGLGQFSRDGLTAIEFKEMKPYLFGNLRLSKMNDVKTIASTMVEAVKLGRSPVFWSEVTKELNAIDLKDLNLFICKELKPNESLLVVAGEKKSLKDARHFKLQ